jgi:hypothetical protein
MIEKTIEAISSTLVSALFRQFGSFLEFLTLQSYTILTCYKCRPLLYTNRVPETSLRLNNTEVYLTLLLILTVTTSSSNRFKFPPPSIITCKKFLFLSEARPIRILLVIFGHWFSGSEHQRTRF